MPPRMTAKILLVDDSTTTLLMEETLLKHHGKYDVVTAQDGREAVAKAIAENPDLILLDIVMPKMNGFEACREMRRQKHLKMVPIILVTSRGEPENVEAGFECGCSDYLTKPIKPGELLELVDGYLSGLRAR